jgi:DNA-binding NarL/FixJ family response regulator
MASVLVIDDHPFVLQGCRCLLEGDGITTILEAADAATGYELFCPLTDCYVIPYAQLKFDLPSRTASKILIKSSLAVSLRMYPVAAGLQCTQDYEPIAVHAEDENAGLWIV